MSAYYNEFDPKAAAWLRELIKEGLIAPGYVDERSILDVRPHELVGYTQQHFFAGIGGWSYALRLAGVPDSRPIRTGSCPCQPFSGAGKGLAEKDSRHLWPAFRDLITFGEPAITFGEQVASALGRLWLARVRVDMEALGHAFGAADLCAAGVGAPHPRQRLYWMANPRSQSTGRGLRGPRESAPAVKQRASDQLRGSSSVGRVGHAHGGRRGKRCERNGHAPQPELEASYRPNAGGSGERMGDPASGGCGERRDATQPGRSGHAERAGRAGLSGMADTHEQHDVGSGSGSGAHGGEQQAQAVICGFWDNFDIIPCRDGKARRVESGTFPLAHGVSGRVGLLRGYGNAIVPQVAAEFIQASLEAIETLEPQ